MLVKILLLETNLQQEILTRSNLIQSPVNRTSIPCDSTADFETFLNELQTIQIEMQVPQVLYLYELTLTIKMHERIAKLEDRIVMVENHTNAKKQSSAKVLGT